MLNIEETIREKKKQLMDDLNNVKSENDFTFINNQYIKSFVKTLYSELKNLDSPDLKKKYGKYINDFKSFAENELNKVKTVLSKDKCSVSKYDITMFKNNISLGIEHPLMKLYKKIEKIFLNMGFSVVQGPEIELDKYNFEKLNIPPHHPARDLQDTFYVSQPNVLLRSHTSSVQIRTMQNSKPPIQVISPGTVYRVDDIDPQHTPMFYQVEGLVVGEDVSFANLKAVLIRFIKEIFGEKTDVRFRPSYYPYTEPSAAIDMSCTECGGKGCRTCGNSGWITVLGSGMVHPNVLEGVGYDSEKYTGFAFGLGLNRLALIYYGLGEIRKIYENDISLWRQL